MPAIRYFKVSETREVRVQAGSISEAIEVATIAFTHGQDYNRIHPVNRRPGLQGDTSDPIKVIARGATED